MNACRLFSSYLSMRIYYGFFFKYLSSGTSAGLLFALLIIHLMKAVFWLNKIYCKNV